MVHPDVAVLPAARIASSRGVHGDGVQGAEMALDAADLVFEDAVVEASFEFPLAGGGRGDVFGGLAAAEDYEVFFRGDGCC